jgi:hypothetical protein
MELSMSHYVDGVRRACRSMECMFFGGFKSLVELER